MDLVYLLVGFGVGILVGALLQDRVQRDREPSAQNELVVLLKEASANLDKDESVSIILTAAREDDDGSSLPDILGDEMQQNWRNN